MFGAIQITSHKHGRCQAHFIDINLYHSNDCSFLNKKKTNLKSCFSSLIMSFIASITINDKRFRSNWVLLATNHPNLT